MNADSARQSRPTLSAIIIVRNEAHCLQRCLNSIAPIVDEIVVLDSGSVDDTISIARTYGARVETTDWPGFGRQKNRALERARGDWVLSIDADESLSPELAASIRTAVDSASSGINGYFIPFLATWCGTSVRFGIWAGKKHLRLFRREGTRFTNATIHERVLCPPPYGTLDGLMIHDTVASEDEAFEKAHHYAELSAQRLAQKGRGGFWPALTRSVWTFVRGYLLKAGFLDGVIGWKVAIATARGAWLRYRIAGQILRPRRRADNDNSTQVE